MLNFSRNEKIVVMSLCAALILGSTVHICKVMSSGKRPDIFADMQARQSAQKKIVNINTASVEELAGLEGVGPSLADAIVAYRAEHGAFAAKEDLEKVKGIGKKKIAAIKECITL